MVRAEVDLRDPHQCLVVDSVGRLVGPMLPSTLEEPFVAHRYHVIGVDRLHVGCHFACPFRDGRFVPALRGVESIGVGRARFVRELPREDGRILAVGSAIDAVDPIDEVGNPILVGLAHALVGVEEVVLVEAVPHQVLVHPSELSPAVGEREQHLDI